MTRVECGTCGVSRRALQLERRSRASDTRCPHCGTQMSAPGFHTYDGIPLQAISSGPLDQPLSTIGLRSHYVISLRTSEADAHFELGAQR